MNVQSTNRSYSRRRFLQTGSVIGSVGIAGCPWPSSDIVLPPLTEGWADVRTDETVALVLRFDDNIQRFLNNSPVSPSDIISEAENEGYSISYRDVTVFGTEDIPDEEKITGVIDDIVTQESWPGGRRYTVSPGVALADKVIDVSYEDYEASIEFPVQNPDYHVIFPSGYVYTLPKLDRRMANTVSTDRGYQGAFDYKGYPSNRTIPAITHHDPDVAVEARVFDGYRTRVCGELGKLTNQELYVREAFDQLQDAITELGWEIGKEGAVMFTPSSSRFHLNVAQDMIGIHSALTTDLPKLEAGLNSLSQAATAITVNEWMIPASETFSDLTRIAWDDYWGNNPAWTSAVSRREAKNWIETYIASYNRQVEKVDDLFENRAYTVRGPTDTNTTGDYFVTLYDTVDTVLTNIQDKLSQKVRVMETIVSGL